MASKGNRERITLVESQRKSIQFQKHMMILLNGHLTVLINLNEGKHSEELQTERGFNYEWWTA